MIKEIAFVGNPVRDMKRARAFYEGVLGLSPSDEFGPVSDESMFIEYNIGNSTLTIGNMETWAPSKDGPMAALETDSFDETFAKIKDAGSEVVMKPEKFPNCKMGIFRDPDGNQIMLHQKDK